MVGGPAGVVPPDLEQRVTAALLEHPRITEVREFAYQHDPGSDQVYISFAYELDGGEDEAVVEGIEVVV